MSHFKIFSEKFILWYAQREITDARIGQSKIAMSSIDTALRLN